MQQREAVVRGALQGVGGERGGRDTFGSLAWAAGCVYREQGTQESWADRV